ncbi:MAG TPA: hypothetical protein VFH67_00190, partial [bacterium]|nr:hypothetical protein [bacterium]
DTTASRQGVAVRLGFELEAEAAVAKPKLLAAPRQLRTSSSAAGDVRKVLQVNGLDDQLLGESRNLLISGGLQAWLTTLDDFRNWLIRAA